MSSMGNKLAGIALCAALLGAPAPVGAAMPAPGPAASSTSAWLTLSMLAPSSSAFLGSTSVAATQPDAQVPPAPVAYSGPSTPPLAVIAIWAVVLGTMVYLATKNHHRHPVPNSPA